MTMPESQPESSLDKIRGDYIDITVKNPSEYRTFLENQHDFLYLYCSNDRRDLPKPLQEADLSYMQLNNEINMRAEIGFDPQKVGTPTEDWRNYIEVGMKERLEGRNQPVYSLAHDKPGFYVILNDEYAAHVQMESETFRCNVTISLERAHELEYALEENFIDFASNDETDPYLLFKEFTTLWTHAIDVVAEGYGNPKRRRRRQAAISLSVPAQPPGTSAVRPSTKDSPAAKELESSIPERERLEDTENTFDMLGGLEYPKQRLRAIADTFNDPEGTKLYGLSAGHFMLYGPAGNGKSTLVDALAAEIKGATVQLIPSSKIMDSLIGESGKKLAAIFTEAFEDIEPHIMFFDEFDAIAGKSHPDTVSHIEVKKLLNQYILEASKNHPNIIIAAATNLDPHQIEDSLIRSGRLEPIGVPLPSESERVDIWAAVLAKSYLRFTREAVLSVGEDGDISDSNQFVPYDEDIDVTELSAQSEGMTGADFEQILSLARRNCYIRYRQSGERCRVNQAELLQAIQQFYQR